VGSRFALVAALVVAASGGVSAEPAPTVPWFPWQDLTEIARLRSDDIAILSSSHCPTGCAFDRHSAGDSRFLWTENGEGVIFDSDGPGAVTRIWMTQGDGVSAPLDPTIRIRIRIDGAPEPVVDLPLPELFDGLHPPFVEPLVSDRTISSGGNVSYVPIVFRRHCRITLVGADEAKIWYQVTARRLLHATGVQSFDGTPQLGVWKRVLASPGADPWPSPPAPPPTMADEYDLAPGEVRELVGQVGSDVVTGLRLRLPRAAWHEVRLLAVFDGAVTIDMSVADLFGIGRARRGGTRSVLIGVDDDDELYCYFPMPYFRRMRLALARDESGSERIPVAWSIRWEGRPPPPDGGRFHALLADVRRSRPGEGARLLDLKGRGRWVGMSAEIGGFGRHLQYLEGDEMVRIDGALNPTLYGTGVEDFFGGGFYFRVQGMLPRRFSGALNGMTYHMEDELGMVTGAYRLMVGDGVPFASNLDLRLEGGREGELPIRVRATLWYYLQ
jgi:hypothetical protein